MVAVVLPVGQYLGRFVPPARQDSPGGYEVRVGSEVFELDEDEITVWTAAMGDEEVLAAGGNSTRLSVEVLARNRGVADANPLVTDLLTRGLLVQVVPTDNALIRFAETYRAAPSALGLGPSPDNPAMALMGLPEDPRVAVPLATYQVWSFSSRHTSLWATCEAVANALDIAEATPAALLRTFFESLPSMLGVHCVYVDRRL